MPVMRPRVSKTSKLIWVTGSAQQCEPRQVLFMWTWPTGSVIRAFVYSCHWGSHCRQVLLLFMGALRVHLAGPRCCPVISFGVWFFVLGRGDPSRDALGFAYGRA